MIIAHSYHNAVTQQRELTLCLDSPHLVLNLKYSVVSSNKLRYSSRLTLDREVFFIKIDFNFGTIFKRFVKNVHTQYNTIF